MAQKVGKTGTGRKALVRFFRWFLDETLYEFDVPDLPDRDAYETILDGRDPGDATDVPMGVVIKGPWGRI